MTEVDRLWRTVLGASQARLNAIERLGELGAFEALAEIALDGQIHAERALVIELMGRIIKEGK